VATRRWKNLRIRLLVSTQCTNVTDTRRTDRQTPHDGIGRACSLDRYCRAMLCISAAYRRAVSVRLSVCLSVYVSVTFMYSIEKNKRIFNFFSPSGSHTILVFPHQTLWKYSDEDPIPGAKIVIFDQYLAWHPSLLDHRVSLTFPQWRIGYSIKRRRLLMAGDGRRTAEHQWILFMSESLDVTLKTTEQNLVLRTDKSEAKVTNKIRSSTVAEKPRDASCDWIFC